MTQEDVRLWTETITQVLIVVIPIIITWIVQVYVKGSKSEKDLGVTVRLANMAIDFAENLDKRGALGELPENISRGLYKLGLAAEWMETELRERHGIKISNEEAEKWISAEFQKRVGGVFQASAVAELAKSALETIESLEKSGLIVLPAGVERSTALVDYAADWVITQMAEKKGAPISREEALAWVRQALFEKLQVNKGVLAGSESASERLAALAQQAVQSVDTLLATGLLKISPGDRASDVRKNAVVAHLMVDATQLEVSLDQISAAAEMALQQ